MNIIAVLGAALILAVLTLRIMARSGRSVSRVHLVVAAMPLLLTLVIPSASFVIAGGDEAYWARSAVASASRTGILLSFVLFVIGAVLTLRALVAGDRQAATLLALETALAGLPAALLTAYAVVFRLI